MHAAKKHHPPTATGSEGCPPTRHHRTDCSHRRNHRRPVSPHLTMQCCVSSTATSCADCSHLSLADSFCATSVSACLQCGTPLSHLCSEIQPPPPASPSAANLDSHCSAKETNHPMHRDCKSWCGVMHASDHCTKCSCRSCEFCSSPALRLHLPPPPPLPLPPVPCPPPPPPIPPLPPPPPSPHPPSPAPPPPWPPLPYSPPHPPLTLSPPPPPSPIDASAARSSEAARLSAGLALLACLVGCVRRLMATARLTNSPSLLQRLPKAVDDESEEEDEDREDELGLNEIVGLHGQCRRLGHR